MSQDTLQFISYFLRYTPFVITFRRITELPRTVPPEGASFLHIGGFINF